MTEINHEAHTPDTTALGRCEHYLRICALACVGLLLVGLVCAVLLVPRTLATLDQADQALTQMSSVDWQALSASVQKSFDEAGKALEGVDVEALNDAIRDLRTVIEPLARLFSR